MPARDIASCVRCKQEIETNQIAIVLPFRGRTVGIQPRIESDQVQGYVCVECAMGIAMGVIEMPRNQPLAMLAHAIICQIVADCPTFVLEAWQRLRKRMDLPRAEIPFLAQGEVLPPDRALKAAV
jgi:hypothetical protein